METKVTNLRSVLDSSPNKNGFSSSKTKHDRQAWKPKVSVLVRKLQEVRSQTQKLS
jgi:hypothetical protein